MTELKLVRPAPVPGRIKKLYLGRAGGPEMQQRAMELFPVPNERGELYMAQQWLECVRYLRSRKKWILDRMK